MAQNVLARAFELRCRNFPDFHLCCIFLPGLRFQVSLAAVFGDFSLVSSPLLGHYDSPFIHIVRSVITW